MLKFLIPIDGSEQSERAVKHVIRLAGCANSVKIYLLNVREWTHSWEVGRFLNKQEIARMQQSEGEVDLRSARALLDKAGVDYEASVVAGPVAQTIADSAKQQGCDHIFMGSHGRGGLAGLLLGSVAMKVIHLTRIPVTVVK
jgi:nucleotide-binding universal stress UspA family protein